MFNGQDLFEITQAYEPLLRQLAELERSLNRLFVDSESAIRGVLLSVASGEPMLFVGPPGVAKSLLIRSFCQLTGLATDGVNRMGDYFEHMLTAFTEPGELYGFWDIEAAQRGVLERMNKGHMMQDARVVYLDEFFNGSSAIVNHLLDFLNERIFHDHTGPVPVSMECLFASTNLIPEDDCLKAVYDRFLIRCWVRNVTPSAKALQSLVCTGWDTTYGERPKALDNTTAFWDQLTEFRTAVAQNAAPVDQPHPAFEKLAGIVDTVRTHSLSDASNRRLIKFCRTMAVHRILDGCIAGHSADAFNEAPVRPKELQLFVDYFLDVNEPAHEQIHGQIRNLTHFDLL